MPYTTEFIDDGRGIVHVGTGIVHGHEILASARTDRESPERMAKVTHGLVDLTRVTELKMSVDDLRRITMEHRMTAKAAPRAVIAVVAPRDHVFGMARMWEAFATEIGWTIRVFRERGAAETWLRETLNQTA